MPFPLSPLLSLLFLPSWPLLPSPHVEKEGCIDGYQAVYTHGFVVEFETDQDRRFYLERDEAHKAFVSGVKERIERIGVLDFEGGVF